VSLRSGMTYLEKEVQGRRSRSSLLISFRLWKAGFVLDMSVSITKGYPLTREGILSSAEILN